MINFRYFNQLYKSFKSVGGFIIGVVATLATILSIKYENEIGLNFWLIIIFFIVLILVLTLFDLSIHFFKESLNKSPRIIKVLTRNNEKIILTEYSEMFQIQGLVTVFHFNDEFEDFVGYGEVINIQNDKKIQILIKKLVDETKYKDLNQIKADIIVKPFVTTKTLEE